MLPSESVKTPPRLTTEQLGEADIARLEEMRLACVEDRIDAEMALGRHAKLVPELEYLVRGSPLRERARGQHDSAGDHRQLLRTLIAGRIPHPRRRAGT